MIDEKQWRQPLRYVLILGGAALLILAVGFFFRWSWTIDLWPWSDSRLSHIFISSILAATAVPAIWIGLTDELGAGASGALDLTVMYGGLTGYLLWLYADQNETHLLVAAIVCGIGCLSSLAGFILTNRIPIRDPRPMPVPVRVSFGAFALALILVSIALLTQQPHIFPWPLSPQSSVVYGFIFLGAAVYFIHGIARPSWHNAAGQLIGFLAYDLVLIWPFLGHLPDVADDHRLSLYIYLAVIIYSGVLATYYLFINQATRIWSMAPATARLDPPSAPVGRT